MPARITRSKLAKTAAFATPAALLTACVMTFGGSVSGLTGSGLVLHLTTHEMIVGNCGVGPYCEGKVLSDESLSIAGNGPYAFKASINAPLVSVSARIENQPAGQICLMDTPQDNQGITTGSLHALNVECFTPLLSHVLAETAAGSGMAADGAGNVYVAAGTVIRKISADGTVTTLAGTYAVQGSADGTGAEALFSNANGIAIDHDGNLYVTDSDSATVRKISPAGAVTTLAGTAGVFGSADGFGAAASFWQPWGIAVDHAGNAYVTDTFNGNIRKIAPDGRVTTLAGTAGVVGKANGSGAAASFGYLRGITVDTAGNLYVADSEDNSGNGNTIRKITPSGGVTTWAGSGWGNTVNGTGTSASFRRPSSVAADSLGNVYVTEQSGAIRKISPTRAVTTIDQVTPVAEGPRVPSAVATSAGRIYYSKGQSVVWATQP